MNLNGFLDTAATTCWALSQASTWASALNRAGQGEHTLPLLVLLVYALECAPSSVPAALASRTLPVEKKFLQKGRNKDEDILLEKTPRSSNRSLLPISQATEAPKNKILSKIKRCLLLVRKAVTNLDSVLKSRDITNTNPSSQRYGLSSSHVWMWQLDHKEGWAPKNWCFGNVTLEKTLESPELQRDQISQP